MSNIYSIMKNVEIRGQFEKEGSKVKYFWCT